MYKHMVITDWLNTHKEESHDVRTGDTEVVKVQDDDKTG